MLLSSNVFTVTSFDALAYNTILLVRFCCAFSRAVWLSRFRQCHTAPDKLFPFLTHTATRAYRQVAIADPVRFCSLSYFAVFSKYFSCPSYFLPPFLSGGDEGTRTPGPRLAKAMLSQLSYIPIVLCGPERTRTFDPCVISTVL